MCFIKLVDMLTGQLLFVQEGDGFNVTNDPFKAKSFDVKSQETLDWFDKYEANLHGLFPAPQWHVSFYSEGDKSNDDFCTNNGAAPRGAEATSRDTAVRTAEQQQSQASGHDALDDAISKR